ARGAHLCWGEMVECVGSGVRGGKMEEKGFNGVAGNTVTLHSILNVRTGK
nr:hypothetical protein [Tanacetum cinerariifolium]